MHTLISLVFAGSFFVAAACPSFAEPASVNEEMRMVVGELDSVKVNNLTRISLTNPDIADIVNYDENEILLIAKKPGQTILFIWDDQGKYPVFINVTASDLDKTIERLKGLLKTAEIETVQYGINQDEAKIVLSGEIIEDKSEIYTKIIDPFASSIINLVKVEPIQDLVQIDMQITELNTTLNKTLGFDWNESLSYGETVPVFDGSLKDLFKIGDFTRSTQLTAVVNALVEQGKGRVLSKPKIVVVSGQEAEFLVGGEIPIRTVTISETGTAENVEFKEFGIGMTVTPTIIKNRIDMTLSVEVSEIDSSSAGTSETDVGFSTRSANTKLFLDDGQTIVLAGLIKRTESKSYKKVPFLGDVPIVGLLFRKTSNPVADIDQELVISLTPHILTDRLKEKESMAGKPASAMNGVMSKKNGSDPTSMMVPYYLGIPKEMDAYVQAVQEKISQNIAYPEEAQTKGWEGTVKVGLLILQDGTLAYASVKESSGKDVFDEIALSTARMASPFASFPVNTDLRELNITIPIVYSFNR